MLVSVARAQVKPGEPVYTLEKAQFSARTQAQADLLTLYLHEGHTQI